VVRKPEQSGDRQPFVDGVPPDALAVLDDLEVGEFAVRCGLEPVEPPDGHRQPATIAEVHAQPFMVDFHRGRRREPIRVVVRRTHSMADCTHGCPAARMTDIDGLLEQARLADPADRINLRDSVAALGEPAIEPMTTWLDDPRLSGFAVRVLERIGRVAELRSAVVDVFTSVDRSDLPAHLVADLEWALTSLGVSAGSSTRRTAARTRASGQRANGIPGRDGVGYWAMRTSPWERPYIWSEAQAGRLRQGWGWADEQDLGVIEATLRAGKALSEEQQVAWRSRRMLSSQSDGMRVGDLIVSPNLREWGELGVFRLIGEYEYVLAATPRSGDRFGHILPVELLVGPIQRRHPSVSDALLSTLRNLGRLWNINGYGGDVERLVHGFDKSGARWTDDQYLRLFTLYPADGRRPTTDEAALLARELDRTVDAVQWQWDDGAAYVAGRAASTTSQSLMRWLDRQRAS
jgi:hypothetical protein